MMRYCANDNLADIDLMGESDSVLSWRMFDQRNSEGDSISSLGRFFGAVKIRYEETKSPWGSAKGIDGYQAMVGIAGSSVTFNILGKNPVKSVVKTFINSHELPHSYVLHIANWESGYEQFNGAIYPTLKGTPKWGAPDGWGIFQIDHYDQCSANPVTADIVWNWKVNVDEGVIVTAAKRADAARRQTGVEAYNFKKYGDDYVRPPQYITINGHLITPIDACAIQAYNGVDGPAGDPPGDEDNRVYSTGTNGVTTLVAHCMEFVPPSTSGAVGYWRYRTNSKNYVENVLGKGP